MAKKAEQPLAALRTAILAEDWGGVRKAYTALTGAVIEGEAQPRPAGKATPSKKKPAKRAAKPPPPVLDDEAEAAAAEAEESGGVILVNPGPTKSEMTRPARPVETAPRFQNKWRPPAASPRELALDRKLLRGVGVSERDREAYTSKEVQVDCDKCGRRFKCMDWEANRSLEGERMRNICPKCTA